ncbi:MAG: DUF6671 family protein [Leptospirillia bacterium]
MSVRERVKTFSNSGSFYEGERVALLTRHGKERVLAEVLEPDLRCRIVHVTTYDTDLLGTFTREIPRVGTQIEAARRKARLGMELASLPLGLASEGAFGPDPILGVMPWNIECLLWIDDKRGIEVSGLAQGKAVSEQSLCENYHDVIRFAEASGFPDHHLVVRWEGAGTPRIFKGISNWKDLERIYTQMSALSGAGRITIEVDLRAHANPTRMETIRRAAVNLLENIRSLCPACGMPGFSVVERIEGRPCADCGGPTHEIRANRWVCQKCLHQAEEEKCPGEPGNPLYCDYCNP